MSGAVTGRMVVKWLQDVTLPFGLRGRVGGRETDEVWIQVQDPKLGNKANGRKWRISQYATRAEVVQTALMATLAWLEHEAREGFLYRGRPVFQPHHDLDALWKVSTTKEVRR